MVFIMYYINGKKYIKRYTLVSLNPGTDKGKRIVQEKKQSKNP